MLEKTHQSGDKFKRIDQMLEDFAGDEVDEFEASYNDVSHHHKHYSADEDAVLDIDELY